MNCGGKPGKEGIGCTRGDGMPGAGMKECAMLMAMESMLAREKRGGVCGGHMVGVWVWRAGEFRGLPMSLAGLRMSEPRGLGEAHADGGEEKE